MASNEIATLNKKKLTDLLGSPSVKNKLEEILGKNAPTFATSVVQIQSQNTMLAEATPDSIIGAALTSATLNLPLNNQLGHAYIVPFREKQPDNTYLVKAQFMLGYKGLKQLCTRSGLFKISKATEVREGEIQSFNHLTGDIEFKWEQDYGVRQKLKIVGYVHYYELLNGFRSTRFMTIEELTAHAKKYSQTFKKNFGQWKDDFPSMCLKTITKLHLNEGSAPISIGEALGKAMETDQATIEINESGEEKLKYVDNDKPVDTDHDLERQKHLVDTIKTLADVEFAEPHVTDPTLVPVLQAKKLKLQKGS